MRIVYIVAAALLPYAGVVLASCGTGSTDPAASAGPVGAGGVAAGASSGGNSVGGADGVGGAHGPGDAGTGKPPWDGATGDESLDAYVGKGGPCAPQAGSGWEAVACCNDTPCRGWCYEADVGVACSCGAPPMGVPGGCLEGTVCCGSKCVAPGWCDFSH